MTNDSTDRTGHEKWLIYCPQISPDTLLHLSIQGTSYALRDFTGRLTSKEHRSAPGHPFKAHDDAGQPLEPTAEFKRNFQSEWKVDVYDQGVARTKVDRWRDIITRHNLRLGIGNWHRQYRRRVDEAVAELGAPTPGEVLPSSESVR